MEGMGAAGAAVRGLQRAASPSPSSTFAEAAGLGSSWISRLWLVRGRGGGVEEGEFAPLSTFDPFQ
jgi:hypothetical protein